MLLDRRYARPSDNPIRVVAYAVGGTLLIMILLLAVSAAVAGNYGENTGFGSSKTSTSASTGGWFRDPMTAGSDRSHSANRDTCGCTNAAGRKSGPV